MTGATVHWDNSPRHRGRRTLHKRVDIASRIIDVARGNVTSLGITYWRLDAVPYVHRHPQILHPVGVGVMDGTHRLRTDERTAAVRINHRRAPK